MIPCWSDSGVTNASEPRDVVWDEMNAIRLNNCECV